VGDAIIRIKHAQIRVEDIQYFKNTPYPVFYVPGQFDQQQALPIPCFDHGIVTAVVCT
jgi:hypothetical protein